MMMKSWQGLKYNGHKGDQLLLNLELLPLHLLLLLLLKLVLASLNLCYSCSCILSLSSLILPHLLKYGK